MLDIYGFVGSLATVAAATLYLLWVLAPVDVLRSELPFLPDPYWGLVPPALLLMFIYIYTFCYGAFGLLFNADVSSWSTVTDGHRRRLLRADIACTQDGAASESYIGVESGATPEFGGVESGATPEFGDMPVMLVNKIQRLSLHKLEGAPS